MSSNPSPSDGGDKDVKKTTKVVKGILKKSGPGPVRKDFHWDEENLNKNEEEKVPRMKIDEPPTPYYDPEADGEELLGEEDAPEIEANGPNLEPEEKDDTKSSASVEELGFSEARKRHYQMGGVLKKKTRKKNMAEYLKKINAEWGVKAKE
mmetsp:Transcript_8554/g.11767  ORF Transcript_8554/g.11767 Transcript_8554/m.11767 type:complete len:151 (-) Transcript_8554:168-620(-)